jgi:hypothetical protein
VDLAPKLPEEKQPDMTDDGSDSGFGEKVAFIDGWLLPAVFLWWWAKPPAPLFRRQHPLSSNKTNPKSGDPAPGWDRGWKTAGSWQALLLRLRRARRVGCDEQLPLVTVDGLQIDSGQVKLVVQSRPHPKVING